MAPFEIAGNQYQAGKMLPFDQMAVAKRLMPVIKHILTPEILNSVMQSRDGDGKLDLTKVDLVKLVPAIADAIYSLSDDDAERIVRTAIKVVQRKQPGGLWVAVMTGQGVPMFDDIDLPVMLQIAWKVIEADLGSFFSTPR